jgi:hypothetical protein
LVFVLRIIEYTPEGSTFVGIVISPDDAVKPNGKNSPYFSPLIEYSDKEIISSPNGDT